MDTGPSDSCKFQSIIKKPKNLSKPNSKSLTATKTPKHSRELKSNSNSKIAPLHNWSPLQASTMMTPICNMPSNRKIALKRIPLNIKWPCARLNKHSMTNWQVLLCTKSWKSWASKIRMSKFRAFSHWTNLSKKMPQFRTLQSSTIIPNSKTCQKWLNAFQTYKNKAKMTLKDIQRKLSK